METYILMTVFFFSLGLIIGSFLNVVVIRIEQGMTLGGRSLCPSCRTLIRWYDNIPLISFFLLRGHCRNCQSSISWQYPLVEALTGTLFALFGTLILIQNDGGVSVSLVWHLFLITLLIAIATYDIRNMEIPLILLMIGMIGAIVYALVLTFVAGAGFFVPEASWKEILYGGSVAALLFYGLVFYSKETWMGMGDVWLAGIAGAAVGLSALLLLFTLSFFFGAIVGGGLLIYGKKGMRSQIPFAPFLSLGTLTTLFVLLLAPPWLPFLLLPNF